MDELHERMNNERDERIQAQLAAQTEALTAQFSRERAEAKAEQARQQKWHEEERQRNLDHQRERAREMREHQDMIKKLELETRKSKGFHKILNTLISATAHVAIAYFGGS
jgi:hypothetical protein